MKKHDLMNACDSLRGLGIELCNMQISKSLVMAFLTNLQENCKFQNLSFHCRPLRLGDHAGNRFTIVIRNIPPGRRDQAVKSLRRIQSFGFINFYGPQRFGRLDIAEDICIGRSIVKRNWTSAVSQILRHVVCKGSQEEKDVDIVNLDKDDLKGIISGLHPTRTIEAIILQALVRYGTSEEGCIRGLAAVPYSTRLLWIHAYSSLVWNMAASHRIRRSNTIATGDLRFQNDLGDESKKRPKDVILYDAKQQCDLSLSEVVLPQIGTSSILPSNESKVDILKFLEEDGVSSDMFRVKELGEQST